MNNANATSTLPHEEVEFLTECAVRSYDKETDIEEWLAGKATPHGLQTKPITADKYTFFSSTGWVFDTQAFGFYWKEEGAVVLAFRGTKELRDFLTDAWIQKTALKDYENDTVIGTGWWRELGKTDKNKFVHRGFNRALDGIWSSDTKAYELAKERNRHSTDTIESFLEQFEKDTKVYLAGHSLGGALANVAAAKIALSKDAPVKVGKLVTIGAPRALAHPLSKKLEKALGPERIYRIYKSLDPVPAVPYFGYKHVSGERCFVDKRGTLIYDANGVLRRIDTFGSFLKAVEKFIGSFVPGQSAGYKHFVADHSSEGYLDAVRDYDAEDRLSKFGTIWDVLVVIGKLTIAGGGGAGIGYSLTQMFEKVGAIFGMG